MRFVKPLDETLLHVILKTYDTIITIEDNSIKGGFGSAVLEFASLNNYKNTIKILGIPDAFIEHGSVNELQQLIGMDAVSLSNYFKSLL
jgi:1-deoxy-D-xylulose-5-phosphate synthase